MTDAPTPLPGTHLLLCGERDRYSKTVQQLRAIREHLEGDPKTKVVIVCSNDYEPPRLLTGGILVLKEAFPDATIELMKARDCAVKGHEPSPVLVDDLKIPEPEKAVEDRPKEPWRRGRPLR